MDQEHPTDEIDGGLMRDGLTFPKTLAVLGAIFCVSLGLCGLASLSRNGGQALFGLALIDGVLMVLSAAAILVVLAIWAVVSIFSDDREARTAGLKRLFDDIDRDGKPK